MSIAELLIKDGLITQRDREIIEDFSARSGLSFIKIALNFGYVSRKNYEKSMLNSGYIFQDVKGLASDPKVLSKIEIKFADEQVAIPLRIVKNKVVTVMADPSNQVFIDFIRLTYNREPEIIVAVDLDIVWLSHKLLGGENVKSSVFGLLNREPARSAFMTFSPAQLISLFLFLGITVIGLVLNFKITSIVINILISMLFLLSIAFKLFLALVGSQFELHQAVSNDELKLIVEEELPVYTILLPVYKEDQLIKKLISNLQAIDYPREKLDIKLVIEEDDEMTLNAVHNLDFPAIFEVIIVPFHMPKTKPKACNYGLHFARGKYLTIYDAEDIPDIDQLKKVVTLFNKLPANYICVQSALNYYNRNENFLTRMFTLEYSYWFDYMLPGLDTLNIPIPLGGTSNHFKLENLLELGGWDPFNVTEDADIGVRAYERGFRIAVINSTTYEEANNDAFNWIRQRSRWIKGYMQTYLVHMRNPILLWKRLGWRGFLGFSFFIGATPLTFLVYPFLLVTFIIYLIFDLAAYRAIFPDWVLFLSLFNLMAGNVLMIYLNMMAVFKRRFYELILFSIANPVYWLLHSVAAFKALYQLIFKPFYWEKTEHGLSNVISPTNVVK